MSKRYRRQRMGKSTDSQTGPSDNISASLPEVTPHSSFASQRVRADSPLYFYQQSLHALLESTGMNKDQVDQATKVLDQILTQSQHFSLNNNLLFSKQALKKMQQLHSDTQTILEKQVKISAIVKIQSQIRGFLVRKQISKLSKEDKNSLRLQNVKVTQLILLIKDYIATFQLIIDQYMIPLRTNSIKGVQESSLQYLFGNIEALVSCHQTLLDNLQDSITSSHTPFTNNVGRVFLQSISSLMPAYCQYATNYQASLQTFTHLTKTVSRFQSFLEEINPDSNKFKDYLVWPLDHFNHLEKKLNGLRACYLPCPDYELLDQSTQALGAGSDFIATIVNQQKIPSQVQTIKQLLSVEWQVESEKPLNLLSWSRRKLVKEGPVKYGGTKKTSNYLHLFNDMLLITERLVNGFKFVRLIGIHQITRLEDGKEKDIQLKVNENETVELAFKAKSEKVDWFQSFQSMIDHFTQHRTYGVPLQTLVARENSPSGIPNIIVRCFSWIKENGTQTEGIFRVPGDSAIISNFQRLLDLGNDKEIDFRTCSVHDVAGLVKLFFRELPEPLVPFNLYSKMIEIQQEMDNHGSEYIDKYKREIAQALKEIHEVNLKVLDYLVSFLDEFSSNKLHTKMDISNLAMVFAPNIIRPEVDTVDTAMESAYVSKLAEAMILYHSDIWQSFTTLPVNGTDSYPKETKYAIPELLVRRSTSTQFDKDQAQLSPDKRKRVSRKRSHKSLTSKTKLI